MIVDAKARFDRCNGLGDALPVIRTGAEYRDSIRDGRRVWIDGERADDVPSHPAFKAIVDIRARIYDLAHEDATRDQMSYMDAETGERCPVGPRLPTTRE